MARSLWAYLSENCATPPPKKIAQMAKNLSKLVTLLRSSSKPMFSSVWPEMFWKKMKKSPSVDPYLEKFCQKNY
jgi:hypothetical protein